MTSTDDITESGRTIAYSKDVHFFPPKIGSTLTPAGRQLLEQYGGIAPEDVEAHIYRIVCPIPLPFGSRKDNAPPLLTQ